MVEDEEETEEQIQGEHIPPEINNPEGIEEHDKIKED